VVVKEGSSCREGHCMELVKTIDSIPGGQTTLGNYAISIPRHKKEKKGEEEFVTLPYKVKRSAKKRSDWM